LTPLVSVHKVIPIGNEVSERTTVVAERNTTVHAPTRLRSNLIGWEILVDLFPVTESDRHGPPLRKFALPLKESCCFTHGQPPSLG